MEAGQATQYEENLQGQTKESETHPLLLLGVPQRHQGAAVTHWGPGADLCV